MLAKKADLQLSSKKPCPPLPPVKMTNSTKTRQEGVFGISEDFLDSHVSMGLGAASSVGFVVINHVFLGLALLLVCLLSTQPNAVIPFYS